MCTNILLTNNKCTISVFYTTGKKHVLSCASSFEEIRINRRVPNLETNLLFDSRI